MANGGMSETEEKKSVFRDYYETLIITGIVMNFVWLFVFQAFKIPTPSMVDNLLVGDHIFVNKFIFGPSDPPLFKNLFGFRDVRRGDIVVFRFPEDPQTDYVKRVIGLPGESVEIRDKKLYINGHPLDEPYTIFKDPSVYPTSEHLPLPYRIRDQFGPYLVPEQSYFVMGDNRDQSYDSRYWGPVSRALIKGRPFFVYWSFRGTPTVGKVTLAERVKELFGVIYYFIPNTRWDRMFFVIDSRYHYHEDEPAD